jgi:hypothetical protein
VMRCPSGVKMTPDPDANLISPLYTLTQSTLGHRERAARKGPCEHKLPQMAIFELPT